MDPDRAPTDDLDVRLRWPNEVHDVPDKRAPARSGEAVQGSEPAEGSDPENFSSGLQTALAGGAGVIETTLAAIAVRLDSLSNSTALLRGLVAEQLGDYSTQVHRALALNSRDLEDYKRAHERALEDIEKSLKETESSIQRIETAVAEAIGTVDDSNRQLQARIEQLETQLDAVRADLSKPQEDPELTEAMQAIAEKVDEKLTELAHQADAQEELAREIAARFEEGIAKQDQTLAESLERTQQSIEALRRRIALRARPGAVLDDAAIERIATVVTELLASGAPAPTQSAGSRGRPRRT